MIASPATSNSTTPPLPPHHVRPPPTSHHHLPPLHQLLHRPPSTHRLPSHSRPTHRLRSPPKHDATIPCDPTSTLFLVIIIRRRGCWSCRGRCWIPALALPIHPHRFSFPRLGGTSIIQPGWNARRRRRIGVHTRYSEGDEGVRVEGD